MFVHNKAEIILFKGSVVEAISEPTCTEKLGLVWCMSGNTDGDDVLITSWSVSKRSGSSGL